MTAPGGGVSAGSVHVDVEPQTAGFWAAFVAQTTPGAAAAGTGLGNVLGAAMAARIKAQVEAALRDLTGPAGRHGAAAGNRFGGLFASTARARIQAALRSLPEYTVNIHARATDAERKMRELREQLEALARQRIGIDISEGDARTEIRRLKEELDRLAQTAASPRVRVDTGAASVELRELERELERLDGRRANARVDVDDKDTIGAISRMGLLINLGLTLGPAIIPGAAAAAGAIGGIGLAAASAAPAVGVLALAFAGIGGAVKALGNAQREQQKTANTSIQQGKSLASSADQIRSAERALANTKAQAADQQRRAIAQVADAEKALLRARRDALEVEQSLAEVREEERRAQEDTAINLRKNTADQGKVALEVAELQAQLAAFGGEFTANALDEALARQEELAAQGRRLAADKARDEKTGIDGSKRVLEAQQKILEAQERVTEAVEREAEARLNVASQARQAAFQIAQGEAAVNSARRAGAAAVSAAASTAGAALDKLEDELSTLPESGQRFARFLFGLKPELDKLRTAAADGLLPGAEAGITRLLPQLAGLRSFVGDVADELGDMADNAGDALTKPFWREFFGYIGNDAVPVLRGLATVSGNVIQGFAGMLLGFQPFERQVGGGLINVTERFERFGTTIQQNKSFQGFVSYALTEGPRFVALLGALVDSAVQIGRAYAPVGSVVVGVLRAIAATLNAVPLPVLTALVVGITAYKTAVLLAAGANALLNSGLLTSVARMITYKTVTDAAGASTTAAQRALTGASAFIGGPFTLALTGAIVIIGYFIAANQKMKAEIDSNAKALGGVGDEYKKTGKVTSESIAKMVQQNPKLQDLTRILQAQGLTVEDLGKSYQGNLQLQERVLAAARKQADADAAAHKAAFERNKGFGDNSKELEKAERSRELVKSLEKSYADAKFYVDAYTAATEAGADATADAVDVFDKASPAVRKTADAYKILASETSTAAEKASALKDAEDALFGAARDADEAAEAQAKAIRTTNKALDDRATLSEKGAKKLDINTDAGARLRDVLKDELQAINATYRANVAAGKSIDEATKQHDKEVEALKKKAAQKGVDQAATQKLIDLYGRVPTSATTAVTISGLDGTKQQLDELLAYQYALRNGITLGEAKDKLNPLIKSPGGRGQSRSGNLAEGGPVVGPGTGTSDSVPAYERTTGARFALSNGEFVQPTASVDYYGQGFMEALRRRAIPRDAVRGYATGGLIDQILSETYPFPTNVANSKIPTRAEVAAAVAGRGGLGGGWPSSPGAQRGDSGVWRQVLALIKAGPKSGSFGNAFRAGDPLWHGCVPMDTAVLTRRGWVPFEDVRIGVDETVGYNPATGLSEWTLIVGMHHYQDAELWTISDGRWEVEVTPGHKWLTDHGLVETRDLTPRTLLRLSTPLASDVDGPGLTDEDRGVVGVERVGSRTAEVFCPTTTLGTWTAKQGNRVFLTGNSGRAVDWMGYNQDSLASYLAAHRPLELIHRTRTRDYAYTRGQNRGSFNNALMEAHRNHIHIALAKGGLVDSLPFGMYDSGGYLPQGLSLAYNGTGRPEPIANPQTGSDPQFNVVLSAADPQLRALVSMIDVRVEKATTQIARDLSRGPRT